MKLPVANQPWAAKALATTALIAVVALWGGGPAYAQDAGITPARKPATTPPSSTASAPRINSPTSMVNQIQMLKEQNRELLGRVEQLQHQLDQVKEMSKEQYIALDTRIKRLESGSSSSAPASGQSTSEPSAADAGTTASAASTPASATSAPTTDSSSAPASASTSLTSDADAQKMYDAAFNALRSGDFVKSSRGFRAFTQQYPHDKLTPNAWYWLGESYYITQNYKQAMKAFDAVLQQFPESGKAPGALLKKGYCQDALKQTDAARTTLKSVISKFPDTSASNLAKQRLEDIRLQQQLN